MVAAGGRRLVRAARLDGRRCRIVDWSLGCAAPLLDKALLQLAQLLGEFGREPFADELEVTLDERDLATPSLVVDPQERRECLSGEI
jgi:hypothetical protein